jgi:hypothetical protein
MKPQNIIWKNNMDRSRWSQKQIATTAQIPQPICSTENETSAEYPGNPIPT